MDDNSEKPFATPTANADGFSPEFNNEKLKPDMNQVFPDEHIRFEDETEEQQRARTQAGARPPPKSARYYGQDGNRPDRHGSHESDAASSASSSDAYPLYSDDSSHKGLERDRGTLSTRGVANGGSADSSSESSPANTLADRRGRARPPPGLRLANGSADSTGSVEIEQNPEPSPPSSAKFRELIEARVKDPEMREKLVAEFDVLNDGKNRNALAIFDFWKESEAENRELKSDYYSGAGGERRRVRAEKELHAKEMKALRRQRKVEMALGREVREAEAAGSKAGWSIDPVTGELLTPESQASTLSDELGSEEGSQGQAEFYSDDEDEDEVRGNARRQPLEDNDDEDWPGDRRMRVALTTSKSRYHARNPTQSSTLSLDKPLPSLPDDVELEMTMINVQILIRLIPIKANLIQQAMLFKPDKQTIHSLCEEVSTLYNFAEEQGVASPLQGRCAFYIALAEYLRLIVDGDPDEVLSTVIFQFQNAGTLCGDVYEEGIWGEAWVAHLKSERGSSSGGTLDGSPPPASESPDGEEKKGRGLVNRFWSLTWDRSKTGAKGEEAVADGEKSSSFGGRFAAGQGQKLQTPEDVRTKESDDEEVRSKKVKPVGLGITIDGGKQLPAGIEPVIVTPERGIFASPERYAHGFGRSPTTPSIDKIKDAGVHSPDAEPSPPTQNAPAPKRYRIVNGEPSTDSTPELNQTELPAPVTASSAVVSPGGQGVIGNLARRASQLLISPTSDASSAHSPRSAPGRALAEELEDSDNNGRRLSIAERRRNSVIRGASFLFSPKKSQDTIIEAEEGNSPLKQEFGDGVMKSTGSSKRSPLGNGEFGEEGNGMRRRRSAGRGDGDMV